MGVNLSRRDPSSSYLCYEGIQLQRRCEKVRSIPLWCQLAVLSLRQAVSPELARTPQAITSRSTLQHVLTSRRATSPQLLPIEIPNHPPLSFPGRLIDHSSSEDEAEEQSNRPLDHWYTGTRRKQEAEQYHSEQFVHSERVSSDADTSDNDQRLRKKSSKNQQQIENSKASAHQARWPRDLESAEWNHSLGVHRSASLRAIRRNGL